MQERNERTVWGIENSIDRKMREPCEKKEEKNKDGSEWKYRHNCWRAWEDLLW